MSCSLIFVWHHLLLICCIGYGCPARAKPLVTKFNAGLPTEFKGFMHIVRSALCAFPAPFLEENFSRRKINWRAGWGSRSELRQISRKRSKKKNSVPSHPLIEIVVSVNDWQTFWNGAQSVIIKFPHTLSKERIDLVYVITYFSTF